MAEVEEKNRMVDLIVRCCETLDDVKGVFSAVVDAGSESESFLLYDKALAMYDKIIEEMQTLRLERGSADKPISGIAKLDDVNALTSDAIDEETYRIFNEMLNKAIVGRNRANNKYKLAREESPYKSFSSGDFVHKLTELKVEMILDAFFTSLFGAGGAVMFHSAISQFLTPSLSSLATIGYFYVILSSMTLEVAGCAVFEALLRSIDEHKEVSKVKKFLIANNGKIK